MNSLMNNLTLVYPPFSNQEGDWLYRDPEVREYVKNSKLYMIVHRPELKFKDYKYVVEDHGYFEFRFAMGNFESDLLRISAKEVMNEMKKGQESVIMELGDKLIRVTNEDTAEVISWYTVDKMLFDIFHKKVELSCGDKDKLRVFWKFDLLYIGISKKYDSFSRLFKNAHHKRLKILTNERQKSENSRLTDEVIILLFDINTINFKTYDPSISIDEFLSNESLEYVKVVADAEKAFVYFLKAKYNEIMFSKYPDGEDGLSKEKFDRYTYEINEEITLCTDKGEFEGYLGDTVPKDFIFVSKEEAVLVKVGDYI